MTFILFISIVILLRISELIYSGSNEKWLVQHGAIEYGQKHYPFIVTLHILFFISLIVEYSMKQTVSFSLFLLIAYAFILIIKIGIILTLGKFWNVKIFHIPNIPLIKNGIYSIFKHPNYTIVVIEIAVIPLIFHLYFTALLFSILNAIMLFVRIREENKVIRI